MINYDIIVGRLENLEIPAQQIKNCLDWIQEMTIESQETTESAWKLLLSNFEVAIRFQMKPDHYDRIVEVKKNENLFDVTFIDDERNTYKAIMTPLNLDIDKLKRKILNGENTYKNIEKLCDLVVDSYIDNKSMED